MKISHLPKVLPVSLVLTLSACGMIRMPDKMDQSNSNMNDMKSKMDVTNVKMDSTNQSIHKQTLLLALNDMLKPENSTYLYPAPTGMMPGGETFAQEATAEELAKLGFLFLKEIDEVSPDDSEKLADGTWPPVLVAKIDHDKVVKFVGLQVIMGFAPQKTVEELVQTQIVAGGRYRKATLALLMLRASFINDLLLQQSLLDYKLTEPGMIVEASNRAESLDYLARLSFKDEIKVKTLGMLDPSQNIEMVLELNMKNIWTRLDRSFRDELSPKYQEAMLRPNEADGTVVSLVTTKQTVAEKLRYWNSL